jgi:iron complex outermembrane receptor protein
MIWRFRCSAAAPIRVPLRQLRKIGEFNLQSLYDAPVSPETIMAYEAGLKGEFLERRLRATLAAYHYDIKNYQVRASPGGVSSLQNAAKVKVDGLDITAEAAVTSQLHVYAGATWLKSQFSKYLFAPGFYPGVPGDATGHDTALAPRFTVDAGGTYVVPLGEGRELRLTGNVTHKSSYVFEADNVLRQPAYTIANASAEYRLNDHLGVEVWIRNIGDKLYNVQMVTTAGQQALAGAPRMYGVDVKVSY